MLFEDNGGVSPDASSAVCWHWSDPSHSPQTAAAVTGPSGTCPGLSSSAPAAPSGWRRTASVLCPVWWTPARPRAGAPHPASSRRGV